MNIQLRHLFAMVVLLASVAFGVSVAAQDGRSCIAPYQEVGYFEDLIDASSIPECSRLDPADAEPPIGCQTIGPTVAQLGLSGHSGSLAKIAPACLTPFDTTLVPEAPAGSSPTTSGEVDCTTSRLGITPLEC